MPSFFTSPHQRTVLIHKEPVHDNFLSIPKNTLFDAYRNIGNAYAFALYIFLASNANGYEMAFSPQAVYNNMGMPLTTCRDQFSRLEEKGYLVQRSGQTNAWDFYETPHEPKNTPPKAPHAHNNRTIENGFRF